MDYLITQRKYLLNDLFEPNAENYRLLGEFNEALKDVVLKSYKQSRELYFNTKKTLEDNASNLNFEGVECKIFLGKERIGSIPQITLYKASGQKVCGIF